jgi:hypothetical protein
MKTPTDWKLLAREKLSPSAVFLLVLCLTELVTLIMTLTCRGSGLSDVLFQSRTDSFMDFFHPLMTFERFSVESMYADAKIFYPPLAMLFYLVLYRIIPQESIPADDFVAREHQITVFPFLLLTVLTMLAVAYVLCALRRGTDLEKKLFAILALLCAPMLYLLDRSNILLLALLFSLLFFYWKDSDSRIKRELSLLCLAIAAGLKIYPALFGLMLVFEKHWREALRCMIYGILSFLLPALAFGGINPLDMISGLTGTSSAVYFEGFGYKVNFSNTFAFLCESLRISYSRSLLNAIALLLGGITLCAILFQRDSWKRICVIAVLIAAIPGLSYMYVMIFMLIPAVAFLNESDRCPRSPMQYVYAVLLSLCLAPLPFTGMPYDMAGPYIMTVSTFVESLCLILLSLVLIAEAAIVAFGKARALLTSRSKASQEN